MRIFKNLLLITLPVLVVVIVIAEVMLRQFFPVDDPFEIFKNRYDQSFIPSQMPANASYKFTSNEGLPWMDSETIYSTNNIGFRGDSLIVPKPPDEIRIFIIGGSTSQCLYLDDSKSIDRIMQEELKDSLPGMKVKVYNASKSGDATSEHIAMLSQRIIHLQPDLVILFSGVNDLRKSIQKYDYLHQNPVKIYSPKYLFLAATKLQTGRRLYYLLKRNSPEELREKISYETNYLEMFKNQQETPVSDSIPHINAHPYSVNLNSIAGICHLNNVPVLFMPNQSTWNSEVDSGMLKRHWLLTCGKVRYREEYLDAGLKLFNDTMRKVAERHSLPLFDLPALLPKTGEYFYDDCHFNSKGSQTTGRFLAQYIMEKKVLR